MKKIFKLLIILMIVMIPNVFAESSKFTPKANLQSTELDKDNYFYLTLSTAGELVNKIESTITYNGRFLEFIDVTSLNDHIIDSGTLTKDGKYRSINIEAKFDKDYASEEYAVLIFRVLDSFKIKKDTSIIIKDYKAYSEDNISKYKHDGIEITVNRETLNRISISNKDYNKTAKVKNMISTYMSKVLIAIVIILIIILLIVLLPTKQELQKTHREKEISKKVYGKYYKKDDYKYDIDDIKSIGEAPKEEPKDKLELGSYDPFKDNVSKFSENNVDSSKEFEAVKESIFKEETAKKPAKKTTKSKK